MKKITLLFLFTYFIFNSYSQNNSEKIFYIVDSIPIVDDPSEDDSNLENSDIAEMVVVTNKDELIKIGYANFDKVFLIKTNEFTKRPDSLKIIPSTKIMKRKSNIWYLNSVAYSGRFIDYYMNGKLRAMGFMKNGILHGHFIRYRKNGSKYLESNYLNGILNGLYKEFHKNNVLSQEGVFENDKEIGVWNDYYSTGQLKRSDNYINGKIQLSKQAKKFYELLNIGINDYFKQEDYKGAIKKYNKAIELNSKYSDAYFHRGTAKLYAFDFDGAKLDFDTAIIIEPFYKEAIANRAFSIIRKYEFKDSRVLNKSKEITIMATKNDVKIPDDDLKKICSDLNNALELGDNDKMIKDAIEKYCKKK